MTLCPKPSWASLASLGLRGRPWSSLAKFVRKMPEILSEKIGPHMSNDFGWSNSVFGTSRPFSRLSTVPFFLLFSYCSTRLGILGLTVFFWFFWSLLEGEAVRAATVQSSLEGRLGGRRGWNAEP